MRQQRGFLLRFDQIFIKLEKLRIYKILSYKAAVEVNLWYITLNYKIRITVILMKSSWKANVGHFLWIWIWWEDSVNFPSMKSKNRWKQYHLHHEFWIFLANLRLITNDVDAAWVDEGDDTIRVVTWQELCGHRQAIHIHRDGRAGHLRDII